MIVHHAMFTHSARKIHVFLRALRVLTYLADYVNVCLSLYNLIVLKVMLGALNHNNHTHFNRTLDSMWSKSQFIIFIITISIN